MLLFDHSPYKSAEDLADLVNILKRKGNLQLREQTICHAPHCEDMINDQVFDYYHDGQRVVINPNKQCCFKLNYLYVKSVPYKKYIYLSNWVKANMMECIQEDYIKPFLLFINGRCIPWEMINIIFTVEEYYLLIESDDDYWNDMFIHTNSWDTVILYDGVEYITGGNPEVTSETLFSFGPDGRFNTANPSIVINNVGTMVSVINYRTDENYINGNKVMDNDDPLFKYRLQPDTTLVFRNNLLDTASTVRYDGTILTVNGGNVSEDGDILYCKIFINKNAFRSVDNIFRTDQKYIEQYVKDMNLKNIYPTYMDLLVKNFDLYFQKEFPSAEKLLPTYQQNWINAINKIMAYNAWLFNYVYRVNSNLDIHEVTGQYLLDRVSKVDGYFRIPRAHADGIQYCMIFVNGELYKYSYNTKYEFNFWAIPVHEIEPDDIVELWFFKNVNNNVYEMKLEENPVFRLVNEDYINDNLVLFAKETKEPIYQYPKYGMQHFPVPFTLEKDGLAARIITDPFYCGMPLTAAYKNQFRMHSYVMDSQYDETIVIDLKDRFMYCNDYAKYMVFVNGRRISTEHFRLVLPVRETTPFSEFYLYITLPLRENDRVDVYYLPCLMKDILVLPELDEQGVIHINKEDINYPLSRDTYMVWVNGKKVPKSYIVDIDATTMRIVKDIKTTDMVYLTKYIDDFDYLTPFFHNNTSIWSMIMKELSADEMTTLLGRTAQPLTNPEPSIYADALPILSIMWELIRDQYEANPYVDPTMPIAYDYLDVDKSVPGVGDVDDGGNILVQSHDSGRKDALDRPTNERPWP